MAFFRRKSRHAASQEEPQAADALEAPEAGETGAAEPSAQGGSPQSDQGAAGFDREVQGPWDESESDMWDPDVPRLDLGSLHIPGLAGIGLSVEADPNTHEVRAITAIAEATQAAVQLQAFAAPRSEGLWDEIRAEVRADIRATDGARVSEHEGSFGPELHAVVPGRTPQGQPITQPLRFVGIDGPRWFLRAVFLGRAAVEPDPDDDLHRLVRETIVVRGSDAMAPGDPLPLRLPEGGEEASDPEDIEAADLEDDELEDDELEDDAAGAPSRFSGIDPFERGPEITEIR